MDKPEAGSEQWCVGIDVSACELVVAWGDGSEAVTLERYANTAAGHQQLLRQLRDTGQADDGLSGSERNLQPGRGPGAGGGRSGGAAQCGQPALRAALRRVARPAQQDRPGRRTRALPVRGPDAAVGLAPALGRGLAPAS